MLPWGPCLMDAHQGACALVDNGCVLARSICQALYRLHDDSKDLCKGVSDDMCQLVSRRRTGVVPVAAAKQE